MNNKIKTVCVLFMNMNTQKG